MFGRQYHYMITYAFHNTEGGTGQGTTCASFSRKLKSLNDVDFVKDFVKTRLSLDNIQVNEVAILVIQRFKRGYNKM